MEDKKNKPVPEKNAKKPTGKSATGKPLDGIEINPQLDDKRRTNEDFAVLAASLQERKALTIVQRQQRARQLKRIEPKLKRAKELSQARLAGPKKLQARAEAKARAMLKSRVSPRKGVSYAELTTAEKIQVDTAVAKKTAVIKRIAARLLPRLRKAEFERLKSFHTGAPMQSLHSNLAAEEFSSLFSDLNDKSTLELVDIIENAINNFERESNPLAITLRRMLNSTIGTDPITETLIKKSGKTGIPFSALKEVFERGLSLYVEHTNQTPEQVAFNRVNSYIAKGRAWTLDADLREEKIVNEELDSAFNMMMEKTHKEIVDRPPPNQKVKRRQQEVQKKIIDEDTIELTQEEIDFLLENGVQLELVEATIRNTKKLIQRLHDKEQGQTYGGKPYSVHPKSVMRLGIKVFGGQRFGQNARKAALLHDTIEDTPTSPETLQKKGFHPDVVGAVQLLSKDKTKSYEGNIENIASGKTPAHKLAQMVKYADNMSNYMASPKSEWDRDRVKKQKDKYMRSMEKLGGVLGVNHHTKLKPKWKLRTEELDKSNSSNREQGTNKLTKIYKKDTPGQEKSGLNENFNMAWTSGIGVTLSAADCGIKIKPGFELHPSVSEEVRSADVEGVVVRTASGKTVVRKQKRNRKIIGTGNLTDGKPDDTV
jgi:hypothetical protein